MAKHGNFDGYIEVNGVDLSDHCVTFDAPDTHEDLPHHAMGDTHAYGTPGLKSGNITATFLQDFAASSVHLTLRPLFENRTIFPVLIQEQSSGNAAQYSADYYVQSYRPIGGDHGSNLMAEVTFGLAGNKAATT